MVPMIDPSAQVQRVTLSEQVEGFIREHISAHNLGPGQTLPSSNELAERFGVSRSIVREAMKSLEAKGMVTVANGKRPIVSPISNQVLVDFFARVTSERDETLIELLELRKGLEVQGANLAATRRTEEDIAELNRLVGQMRAHIGDIERYLDFDVELHLAIVRASKNRMLFHIVDSIRAPLRDTMREGQQLHTAEPHQERIQINHEILVKFIVDGDAINAGECMAYHFDGAITAIKRAMAGLPVVDERHTGQWEAD